MKKSIDKIIEDKIKKAWVDKLKIISHLNFIISDLNFVCRQRRMYETGIYDLSQFYDSNFFIRTLFDMSNNRISSLKIRQNTNFDQFKSKGRNKFNMISVDLKLEHFKLAIKLWLMGEGIAFVCLISEIIMYSVNKF